jgi:hypothetical protein
MNHLLRMMSRPMTLMSSLPTKPPASSPSPYRPHTYRAINIPRQSSTQIKLISLLLHLREFLPIEPDTIATQVSTTIFPLWLAESTAIDMLHFEIFHVPLRIKGCRAAGRGDEVAVCADGVAVHKVVFYT